MATTRGFVQKIDVGRAGLVVVRVLHDDGSVAEYRIPDIDADPERFNERLSKLGVLRDAMTRAEPVEIEWSQKENEPRLIERAARITRDTGALAQRVETLDALVLGISVFAENRTAAAGETPDTARLTLLTSELNFRPLTLDLQIPERAVAAAQLELAVAAQRSGRSLRFWFDPDTVRITGIGTETSAQGGGQGESRIVDGFVESLSHLVGAGSADVALVRFTTAPPFSGGGNVVGLVPFTPETLDLLVFKGSPDYALFEAGLRDALRMRVRVMTLKGRTDEPPKDAPPTLATRAAAGGTTPAGTAPGATTNPAVGSATLVLGAELVAPLASASRPVWIRISRQSLDHGPDGFACTEGVPSNDLAPMSLRDLRLPYPAEWVGIACFNHGVYRFQLALGVEFEILLDGEALCVHDAEDAKDAGVRFAHACLGGEHEVRVKLDGWSCDKQFVMDVYRIR